MTTNVGFVSVPMVGIQQAFHDYLVHNEGIHLLEFNQLVGYSLKCGVSPKTVDLSFASNLLGFCLRVDNPLGTATPPKPKVCSAGLWTGLKSLGNSGGWYIFFGLHILADFPNPGIPLEWDATECKNNYEHHISHMYIAHCFEYQRTRNDKFIQCSNSIL